MGSLLVGGGDLINRVKGRVRFSPHSLKVGRVYSVIIFGMKLYVRTVSELRSGSVA